MSTTPPRPAIVLVSDEYADQLLEEFGRYDRDYELRTARSCAEAIAAVDRLRADHRADLHPGGRRRRRSEPGVGDA